MPEGLKIDRLDSGCYRIFSCFSLLNNWDSQSKESDYHEQEGSRGQGVQLPHPGVMRSALAWDPVCTRLQNCREASYVQGEGELVKYSQLIKLIPFSDPAGWSPASKQWQYIIKCCCSGFHHGWEFPEGFQQDGTKLLLTDDILGLAASTKLAAPQNFARIVPFLPVMGGGWLLL